MRGGGKVLTDMSAKNVSIFGRLPKAMGDAIWLSGDYRGD